MRGTTSTQDTQSQSVNSIPQWVTQAGQQNYAFAQNVANQPLTQYQGQMVADVSPQTQQAWNLAAGSGDVGQDQYGAAQAGFLNSIGQTPASVTAGQLSNTNLTPYENPFTSDVINSTLPIMQQNLALSQNQQGNQANAAGAFGGSRQGVQAGVTQAQGAMGMGQMASQLNQANFQQAQAGATGDINRTLAAQQGNQTAQQQKINSDILASQGLSNLGDSQQRANAANFTMLSQAGASEQGQAQDQINAQMAKFNQANQYPQTQLATMLSALGMTPHDTSTTGQSTTNTTTPTNWGALALGGLQDLSGFFKMGANKGMAKVPKTPGSMDDVDSVPAMLTPGEAILTKEAAAKLGRGKISRLNAEANAGKPKRQRGALAFDDGTSSVPDMDDADLGSQIMGGGSPFAPSGGGIAGALSGGHLAKAIGGQDQSAAPKDAKIPDGWGAPSQGFFVSGFAAGTPKVPGALAAVPSMLTPGQAVLNQRGAVTLGQGKIKQQNASILPSSPLVAAGIKTLAPRTLASFLPPKKAFNAATVMPRAGAKATGGLSNTKLRTPLRGALA